MSRDALVVGINSYDRLRKLTSPSQDAEAIAIILTHDGEFRVTRLPEAVKEGSLQVGQTTKVTLPQLKQALVKLFKPESQQIPDTALFYFSGHGLREDLGVENGYLATSEVNPEMGIFGLPFSWLRQLLEESPIRQQIIWLDCCYSGGLLGLQEANPGERGKVRDRCFIASSRDFEVSYEDIRGPHSVLTKALLEGLNPERFPDRWLTNYALVEYLHQALKTETQQPIFTNFGEAINLTRTWGVIPEKPKVETVADICPYKGLRYFDCNEEDPKYFFGREELTDKLIDAVRQSDFLAILGASGSGKSSVLRAGLLHQLQLGRKLSGSELWQVQIMLPGEHPLRSLAFALVDDNVTGLEKSHQLGMAEKLVEEGSEGLRRFVQTANTPRVMLVVDQFEEVFTLCQNKEERRQFIECLLGALEKCDKLCLILGMRADFFGKCVEEDYSGLANKIQQHLITVTPMNPLQLEAAIVKPASRVELEVESELIKALIKDVEGSPGSLPLLQDTLEQLWQQRTDNCLKLKTYTDLGGVSGTLDKRATKVYEKFDKEQQATTEHIFLNLTQLGEGTEDTRKRVLMRDLVTVKHSEALIEKVVQKLADEKLVVTSQLREKDTEAVVDVAHEALIRHWLLLRQWLGVNRDLLRRKRKIEGVAEEWRDKRKSKDYLLQGKPLKEAKDFQKQQGERVALSILAGEFIQKSSKQQLNNRVKLVGLGLIVPLGLAIWLGFQFWKYLLWQAVGDFKVHKESPTGMQALQNLVKVRESLENIDLEGVNLKGVNLEGANLKGANLKDANLKGANLEGVNLKGANLEGADLKDAGLGNANLSANLKGTNLKGAYLQDADLFGAELKEANLDGAHFYGAYLYGIYPDGVYPYGAYLNGVKYLTSAQIKSACNWQKAIYKYKFDIYNSHFWEDEKANQKFIEKLKQDVASNPKQPPDCSKWK